METASVQEVVTSNSSRVTVAQQIFRKYLWNENPGVRRRRERMASALDTVPTSNKNWEWAKFLFGILVIFTSLTYFPTLWCLPSLAPMGSVVLYGLNYPTMLSLWPSIPQKCSKLYNHPSIPCQSKLFLLQGNQSQLDVKWKVPYTNSC